MRAYERRPTLLSARPPRSVRGQRAPSPGARSACTGIVPGPGRQHRSRGTGSGVTASARGPRWRRRRGDAAPGERWRHASAGMG